MNQRKIKQCFYLFFLSIAGLMPFQTCLAETETRPLFKDGTYFSYDIYWSFLKIATAQLSFHELRTAESTDDSYQIRFRVQSNSLINTIYPIENHIHSTLLRTGNQTQPLIYCKKTDENGKQTDSTVRFDYALNQIIEEKNHREMPPIAMIPDLQDPLSLILSICQNDFRDQSNFLQNVSDGGQIVPIQSSYLKEENIETPVGAFQTQVIDIDAQNLRGVFKKSPNAKVILYLSQNKPAIPVKFKSKVRVGSFYAILSGGYYNGSPIKGIQSDPIEPSNTPTTDLRKRFKR